MSFNTKSASNQTPQQGKPDTQRDGDRQFLVTNWKAHEKNTLRAFLSLTLPSGIIINNCSLHTKDGLRWICPPSSQFKKHDGTVVYTKLVEFATKEDYTLFQAAALRAVDRFQDGRDE